MVLHPFVTDLTEMYIETKERTESVISFQNTSLPSIVDYDADSENDGDDCRSPFDDLELNMKCDNCGLDFWNIWFNNNTEEHLKKSDAIKIKKLRKRRNKGCRIKNDVDYTDDEGKLTSYKRSPKSSKKNKKSSPKLSLRKLSIFKFTSFHILEKFDPRSEKKYTLEYDGQQRLNKVIIGRGHTDEYSELNCIRLFHDITKSKQTDWRTTLFKKLKTNNDKIKSLFSGLPTLQTCLFCFEEQSNIFGKKSTNKEKEHSSCKKITK